MRVASAVLLLAGFVQGAPTAPPLVLRFHHVHLRVADPASSSRQAAAKLAGASRSILQGHGIAVRAGSEYLVFEREDEILLSSGDSRAYGALHASAVYLRAVEWASGFGLAMAPAAFNEVGLRDAVPAARIDTIAFSAVDPARVVEHLSKRGVTPFERDESVARFRLSQALTLEIISETDRPDTHWCPMHPDIRGPGAGKCRLCRMDLVPIPPPRIGEYRLDVTLTPGARGRGAAAIRLQVLDPGTSDPVVTFLDVHEKRFHLFIVSRDLEYFAHVHPEQRPDGTFAIHQALEPGEYLLVADFLPSGGTPQLVQRAVVTPGYSGPLFGPAAPLAPGPAEQVIEGVRVRLETDRLAALGRSTLRFFVSDAASRAPVTDLEPYLGAAGHLLVVDSELRGAIHAHPEGISSSGPEVTFDPVLPFSGRYKLWVQFQRKGRVITVPFVIEATP